MMVDLKNKSLATGGQVEAKEKIMLRTKKDIEKSVKESGWSEEESKQRASIIFNAEQAGVGFDLKSCSVVAETTNGIEVVDFDADGKMSCAHPRVMPSPGYVRKIMSLPVEWIGWEGRVYEEDGTTHGGYFSPKEKRCVGILHDGLKVMHGGEDGGVIVDGIRYDGFISAVLALSPLTDE
jgi:hypothetical protein